MPTYYDYIMKLWLQIMSPHSSTMPIKAFWKCQTFTETRHTQILNFWSNFDPNIPPEDGQNEKSKYIQKNLAIGLSKQV